MSIKRHKERIGGTRRGGDYLSSAVRTIGRRWMLVLCLALLFSAAVAALDFARGLGYTAESLVTVREPGAAGAEGVSAERLGEIRSAAGAKEVSRSAMREIGWEKGIEEFNQRLEVEAGEGGELRVAFSSEEPETAASAANAYAASFVDRVESLNTDRLAGGSLDATAEVVREAAAPPGSRLQPLRAALLAFAPGLAAGAVLALALGRSDRRWRDARDAELALGARVLGVIPERHPETRDPGATVPANGEDGFVREP